MNEDFSNIVRLLVNPVSSEFATKSIPLDVEILIKERIRNTADCSFYYRDNSP
jgi:hypothetical protein